MEATKWFKAFLACPNPSLAMDGMMTIMPLHVTTDNRNARVNPSLKKFWNRKIRALIQPKADGVWRAHCCPVKTC